MQIMDGKFRFIGLNAPHWLWRRPLPCKSCITLSMEFRAPRPIRRRTFSWFFDEQPLYCAKSLLSLPPWRILIKKSSHDKISKAKRKFHAKSVATSLPDSILFLYRDTTEIYLLERPSCQSILNARAPAVTELFGAIFYARDFAICRLMMIDEDASRGWYFALRPDTARILITQQRAWLYDAALSPAVNGHHQIRKVSK